MLKSSSKLKKFDHRRILRVICTVTSRSTSEQNQVQTSGFWTPNLGPFILILPAHKRSRDREMSILGNDSTCVSSDYFGTRDGSKDAPYITAIHSSMSQMGNWSTKRSNLHKIMGLCRKWWSSNWRHRSLAAARGLLSQQHAMNLGCPSAAKAPMHTLLAELWACEESRGDREREHQKIVSKRMAARKL